MPVALIHRGLFLHFGKKAAKDTDYQPNLAVIIRTRNDAVGLKRLLEFIDKTRPDYKGRIDVVVVDTESTDGSPELARQAGAKLVKMPQKNFNYARNINLGLKEVRKDVPVAFILVGHAQPVLSNCIQAGVRHFKDPRVAGTFGLATVHENASLSEKLYYFGFSYLWRGAFTVKRPWQGAMGATNCMVRMSAWRQHNFDEAFGHGGEDMEWAKWAIKNDLLIIFEPGMSVHHTHGLGLKNLIQQQKYWRHIMQGPGEFDKERVHGYRPDLR